MKQQNFQNDFINSDIGFYDALPPIYFYYNVCPCQPVHIKYYHLSIIHSMKYLPRPLKNCFGSLTHKSKFSPTLQEAPPANKIDQHIKNAPSSRLPVQTSNRSPLLPQQLVKQYQPIQIIGQGSFGLVVKARRIKDGKVFAIKTCKDGRINKKIGMPPMILKQLAALKKNQQNKYSIKLQEFIKTQQSGTNSYHFVIQYAEYSLESFLGMFRSQLGIKMKILFIRQLVLGVAEMHSLSILHRDLKPDNILLCPHQNHYTIRIADMGTTVFKTQNQQGLIVQGVGSLWYKPPQALMGIESPGKSYDLWSLGVIIIQILIGRVPFRGCCGIDQLYSILETMGSLKSNNCEDYYMESTPYMGIELPNFKQNSFELRKEVEQVVRTIGEPSCQIISLIWELVNVDPRKRAPLKQIVGRYDFLSAD